MGMRFVTRAFLWSFVPFALLMLGSFWNVQKLVQLTVRDGLRSSLRQTHESIAALRVKTEAKNARFLRMVAENPSLKAGMQLLSADPRGHATRLTVEDQLTEIAETLGADLLLVSSPEGEPRAGVARVGGRLVSMDVSRLKPPQRGFFSIEEQVFEIASTPINLGNENLGTLTLGEPFTFSGFNTPAALLHRGRVLKSSVAGVTPAVLEAALSRCRNRSECEVRLDGETYLTLPMKDASLGGEYELRSLQSVDSAARPVQRGLQNVFLVFGAGTLLAMVVLTLLCSRTIVKPIARLAALLRQTAETAVLPEFQWNTKLAAVHEIRELMQTFNTAGHAIRDAQSNLHRAYVEFVGSLANALDARDRYTAGHSRRVSDYSCAIARALQLPDHVIEEVRVGALLHDIGKIGIADSVLNKTGSLSDSERALIQDHPTIGRRILEGVGGFQNYLNVVELHHESWDGTGYPFGLRGETVPLPARIVHVADAYDAMTSSRPYRRAMSRDEAVRILEQNAGTQFDPAIVPLFARLIVSGSETSEQMSRDASLPETIEPREAKAA